MSNCLNILQSYGDFLSNNTGPPNESPMPHPLIFSGTGCTGQMWPPFEEEFPQSNPLVPFGPSFGSVYIPPYWDIFFYDAKTPAEYATALQRHLCASFQGQTITDTTNFKANDLAHPVICPSVGAPVLLATPMKDKVYSVVAHSRVPDSGDPDAAIPQIFYSQNCWKFDMCNNNITTNIGSRFITSWTAGCSECDDTMSEFCRLNTGYTCRQDPQVNPQGNIALPECACLADEAEIQRTYCQPGNSLIECEKQNALQQYMPVTCFGRNCGSTGYQFKRMQNQKCTVTLYVLPPYL